MSAGLRLPSVCSDSAGAEQATHLQGDVTDADRPLLVSKGMIPGPVGSPGGSSDLPAFQDRSTQAATFPSSALEPPSATSS